MEPETEFTLGNICGGNLLCLTAVIELGICT